MISKSVHLSNGVLYDPRLGITPPGVAVPTKFPACAASFTLQVAQTFTVSNVTASLVTYPFTLHTFPALSALITPTSDDATAKGPILFTSMVLVLTSDVIYLDLSGTSPLTHFTIEAGLQTGSSWVGGGTGLDASRWISTGDLISHFSGGSLPSAWGGTSPYSVFASPQGTAVTRDSVNMRVTDASTRVNSTFYSSPTQELSLGLAVIAQRSGLSDGAASFNANLYLSGMLLPPLIDPTLLLPRERTA